MHECIPMTEPQRWAEALRGIPHAFAHTWGSCHAMSLTSGLETFLYSYASADGRVVCPFAVRSYHGHRDLLTPYGFSGFTGVGSCRGFADHWAAFARAEGYVCGYVGLNPTLPWEPYHAPADLHRHNAVHVLDLTLSEADLIGRMSHGRRQQVRATTAGTRLVHDRARLAAFFGEHLTAFLEARQAARIYHLAPATLDALVACDDVLLLGLERDGSLEAVSMFVWTPHVADFLFNVSTPAGREHSTVLIWQGALRLKALGVPLLNLGGGVRPDDGVATFKARFGGRVLPLAALKQVYDPSVFATLCAGVHADPHDRSGYFPPYQAR